jgi:very-short-patch-repair endonuclease
MNIYMAGESAIGMEERAGLIESCDVLLLHDRICADSLSECCLAATLGKPISIAFGRVRPPDAMLNAARLTFVKVADRDQAIRLTMECLEVLRDTANFIDNSKVLDRNLLAAESPIEKLLAIHMANNSLEPVAQHQVEVAGSRYRLDFAFVEVQVAIETDGHDFHERTKEQAQRDKSRDRDLQAAGWRVLRFTGSEVFSNAAQCAEEVRRIVRETP